MDNLKSAISDLEAQVIELMARRAELDRNLQELECRHRMLEGKTCRHRMLEGKTPATHHHRCPHCGAWAVCPQAYGEDCPSGGQRTRRLPGRPRYRGMIFILD